MDDALPTGKISRGKVVGKTLLKIGLQKGKHLIQQEKEANRHEEIADIIFDALGELKGVSVKIAQQIALGMPFLPPAYLDKISKSFHSIPGINKALVRKIIKSELDAYPHDLFDRFEMTPFAAASLGQVHLAEKAGRKLAVKIQYPGIKKSIETDMSLIHFGLKRFAKGQNVTHIVTEIEERLFEETDYTLEAQNILFFKEHLNNPRIVIADVFPELSGDKVLTTSLLEGVNFDTYLRSNPSQRDINAYAQLIFDTFFYSLYHLKRIHADPNPGNFLFMKDNRLGLIDFGCVKSVSDDFLNRYNKLHLSLLEEATESELIDRYLTLGMIEKSDKKTMQQFYTEVIKPLDTLYKEPLSKAHYDFKANSDFSQRGFEKIFEVQRKQFHSVHKLNEQFLFLNRTLMGYYALFEKMGAAIETGYVRKLMNTFTL